MTIEKFIENPLPHNYGRGRAKGYGYDNIIHCKNAGTGCDHYSSYGSSNMERQSVGYGEAIGVGNLTGKGFGCIDFYK